VETYFTNTPSRIGGIGLEEIAEETIERHRRAFPERPVRLPDLDWGGQYQWRQDGEYHMYNPESIHKLQYSTRSNNYKIFKEYTELINSASARLCTLRGLMDLKFEEDPIPVEEVESVESIMKRFATGAMSFGSISKEAHDTFRIRTAIPDRARSSRSLRQDSALPASIWSARMSFRSRWLRVPSPARAGSCLAIKSMTSSRGCVTPRPVWD